MLIPVLIAFAVGAMLGAGAAITWHQERQRAGRMRGGYPAGQVARIVMPPAPPGPAPGAIPAGTGTRADGIFSRPQVRRPAPALNEMGEFADLMHEYGRRIRADERWVILGDDAHRAAARLADEHPDRWAELLAEETSREEEDR